MQKWISIGLWSFLLVLMGFILCSCRSLDNPTVSGNSNSQRLQQIVPKYQKIARRHPYWPKLQLNKPLALGVKNSIIPTIRQRLRILGDLPKRVSLNSIFYDMPLLQAVKRFQWRHGLKPDGKIGEKTIAALNVSPAKRMRQLQINRQRWAAVPEGVGKRYLHVNIPSYNLDLVENGIRVLNMRVIVGKPSRPTPTLYSKIQTLVFNPKWNVPHKIAKKDILPKVLEDPNYLTENNIQIYSSWQKDAYQIDPREIDWRRVEEDGFPYKFTQAPGALNALGKVKFIFLNDHDVYLHDTPQKGLFEKIYRAFSSGCIRLEKPFHLVEYFIQNDEAIEREEVKNYLSDKKIKYVRIKNPIPLYVTYITAWVDRNGVAHFREDIYQRDS